MEQKRYKIKVTDHIKKDTHTEYTLTIEADNIKFSFQERYSNLKKLSDSMKIEANNNNAFPKFPPKKFFGGEDEKFINKRQQDLNNFFDLICKHPEFSQLPSFIKFIEENKKKDGIKTVEKKEVKSQATPEIIKQNLKPSIDEKETKVRSPSELKKSEEECYKIVNEFSNQFYDVNNSYDKDLSNDNDAFIKFFKTNIIKSENNTCLSTSSDNNFELIGKDDESVNSLEEKNKNKLNEIVNLWKSFEEKYDTTGLIVPI